MCPFCNRGYARLRYKLTREGHSVSFKGIPAQSLFPEKKINRTRLRFCSTCYALYVLPHIRQGEHNLVRCLEVFRLDSSILNAVLSNDTLKNSKQRTSSGAQTVQSQALRRSHAAVAANDPVQESPANSASSTELPAQMTVADDDNDDDLVQLSPANSASSTELLAHMSVAADDDNDDELVQLSPANSASSTELLAQMSVAAHEDEDDDDLVQLSPANSASSTELLAHVDVADGNRDDANAEQPRSPPSASGNAPIGRRSGSTNGDALSPAALQKAIEIRELLNLRKKLTHLSAPQYRKQRVEQLFAFIEQVYGPRTEFFTRESGSLVTEPRLSAEALLQLSFDHGLVRKRSAS